MSRPKSQKSEIKFADFASRMKMIRGNRSQTDVAKRWGIPAQYVSRYESGEVMAGGEILLKIALHESVNLNWLLGIESESYLRGTHRSLELGQMDMLRELEKVGILSLEQLQTVLHTYKQFAKVASMVNEPRVEYNQKKGK